MCALVILNANSVKSLCSVSMHKPPRIDSHGPEREERDWCSEEGQRSAERLAAVHVNSREPEEKGNQKDQAKYNYRSWYLLRPPKVLFNNPRRADDATTIEAGNRCI